MRSSFRPGTLSSPSSEPHSDARTQTGMTQIDALRGERVCQPGERQREGTDRHWRDPSIRAREGHEGPATMVYLRDGRCNRTRPDRRGRSRVAVVVPMPHISERHQWTCGNPDEGPKRERDPRSEDGRLGQVLAVLPAFLPTIPQPRREPVHDEADAYAPATLVIDLDPLDQLAGVKFGRQGEFNRQCGAPLGHGRPWRNSGLCRRLARPTRQQQNDHTGHTDQPKNAWSSHLSPLQTHSHRAPRGGALSHRRWAIEQQRQGS